MNYDLTLGGWIIMAASVTTVLLLNGFCTYRVWKLPPVERDHLKGPLDIDTRDKQDAD